MIKKTGRIFALLLSGLIFAGSVAVPISAKETVTPGTVDYEVHMKDAQRVFIGNEKAVKYEMGRKYFLHYTVESIESNTTTQSGMLISTDKTEDYPYTKGALRYDTQSMLMEEGYTYFFRFEIKEDGVECIAARSKNEGDDSNYIRLPHTYGDITTKAKYFGAWTAETGKITGTLTHVRCYDETGKDLGIYTDQTAGVTALAQGEMMPNTKITHSYSFSLKDAGCIAVTSDRYTDSDEVYLEYKVKNVKKKDITQSGVLLTNSKSAVYPHGDGCGELTYTPHEKTDECQLVDEGATYLCRFTKQSDGYTVLIKRTVNGKTDYFSFPHKYGVFSKDNGYYGIWIGENCQVSADFVDVKCYDKSGNNLAVSTNQGVDILHDGDWEDYSQCEAVYYCLANDTFITLDDECNASYVVNSTSTETPGTYSIRDAVLTLKTKAGKEKYDYTYKTMTDKDGNRYERLRDVTVTYMSRNPGGEVLDTVTVTAKDGYRLNQPKTPTMDNRTFKEWQIGDGTAYDFNSVVTEALMLYAAWDGDGSYMATGMIAAVKDHAPLIAVAASVVLLAGTGLFLGLTGRRKRHDRT